MDSSNPLLDIQDLSVSFNTDSGTVYAVNKLNLRLERGKSVGFVGETGAGKTTTALAILRLIQSPPGRVTSGRIFFNGEDLLRKTEGEMRQIRGGEISMIFQDPMTSLNPTMTVEAQIMEMVKLHSDLDARRARERAVEMLSLVGIRPERAGNYPHQFSGGMRQRVCIAIALACRPSLLIADEPTTALDVTIQAQVIELIKELQSRVKTSMLLITHDLGIVAETCDTVAIMYAGRLLEFAPIEMLFANPMHPYTRGLFKAIPDLESPLGEKLAVIPGLPPEMIDLPEGCSFAPRCVAAGDICRARECGMREVAPGHFVNCHKAFPSPEAGVQEAGYAGK